MIQKYYTVDEVADLIKIHPKTVQRYIREGRLKANKVGKGWRVSGHDLSTFTEGNSASVTQPLTFNFKADSADTAEDAENREVKVSAVVDIPVPDTYEAIRIANTMTAIANSKPSDYGAASVQTQYLMPESVIRVMVWGGLSFMQVILDTIAALLHDDGSDI